MKKVVLAYSGGLDTSFCIKYLTADMGYEIHAVTVDTGGFSPEELVGMEERAYALGAKTFQVMDAVRDANPHPLPWLRDQEPQV